MKKTVSLLFILFELISGGRTGSAQTITVPIMKQVYYTHDTVALDLNVDLNDDLSIRRYSGIDHTECAGYALHSGVQISYPQLTSTPFNYLSSLSLIYQATLGCNWNSLWSPNSGLKYMGVYMVNSPGDTTFGYLTLEFVDPSVGFCSDTLTILSYTYSVQSNVHLLAAQIINGVFHPESKVNIELFPTVSSGNFAISNFLSEKRELLIMDESGRIVFKTLIGPKESKTIDLSFLPNGNYLVSSDKPGIPCRFLISK
ncbi:MAG TPA: hypothetical protein PKL85_08685 [Bacteroidia bacterium]|nr:hypothetical protein [Bacteroidia bacterium]